MGSEKAQIHSFFIHAFGFIYSGSYKNEIVRELVVFFLLLHILRRTLDLTVDLAFFFRCLYLFTRMYLLVLLHSLAWLFCLLQE